MSAKSILTRTRSRVRTRLFTKTLKERELPANIVAYPTDSEFDTDLEETFVEESSSYSPNTNLLISKTNNLNMPNNNPNPGQGPSHGQSQSSRLPSSDEIASFISSSVSREVNKVVHSLEDRLLVKLTESISSLLSVQNQAAASAPSRVVEHQSSSENVQRPIHRLDMNKWNIHFSCEDSGLRIDQFVSRLEHIAITQRYSLEEVAQNIYIFFSGRASTWYFDWIKTHSGSTWSALRQALLDQFRSPETDSEIEHQLYNRLQRFSETFTQYFYVMTDLNSKMRRPRSDLDLIEILKRNVNSKLMLMIHNSTATNLSIFLNECRCAENKLQRIETRSQSKPKIAELDGMNDLLPEVEECSVEALNKPSIDLNKITCFDCKQQGHFSIDCTEKSNRIFCYSCGLDNYVSSKCPRCKDRNFQKVKFQKPMT